MSQHHIDAIGKAKYATIGYDRPLDNFFGTVYDAEGEVIHWVPGVNSVEDLASEMTGFATISADLLATLRDERVHRATHPMMKIVNHRIGAA